LGQVNEESAEEYKVELHVQVVPYALMCGSLNMLTVTNCFTGGSTPYRWTFIARNDDPSRDTYVNCVENRRTVADNNNNNQNIMSSNVP
jgi:hypothetical protein